MKNHQASPSTATNRAHTSLSYPKAGSVALIAFLFLAAYEPCLPNAWSDKHSMVYPWYAKNIGVGRVQLYELVFFAGIPFYVNAFRRKQSGPFPKAFQKTVIGIATIGLLCFLSSFWSPRPLLDMGKSSRLVVNAFILTAIARWSFYKPYTGLLPLAAGLFAGTIVNITLSHMYPVYINDILRLAGQNTPGVAMAVAIHIVVWITLTSSSLFLALAAIASAPLFTYGVLVSYSRSAWGVAAMSLVPLLIVFRHKLQGVAGSFLFAATLLLTVTLPVFFPNTFDYGERFTEGISSIQSKLGDGLIKSSDSLRGSYFIYTTKIVTNAPFGTGFSGFYYAILNASGGRAAEYEALDNFDANPHSTILLYAAAGGILALLATLTTIYQAVRAFFHCSPALQVNGSTLIMGFYAASFILICLVVPYGLNSPLILSPLAILCGTHMRQTTDSYAQNL